MELIKHYSSSYYNAEFPNDVHDRKSISVVTLIIIIIIIYNGSTILWSSSRQLGFIDKHNTFAFKPAGWKDLLLCTNRLQFETFWYMDNWRTFWIKIIPK